MIEAMKQALEALEIEQGAHAYLQLGKADHIEEAITALRLAIEQAERQEPVAWKHAAIRLGEELSSVGPDGYYDMSAEKWLDWAMNQQPRGKNSLPAPPQRQPLTRQQALAIIDAQPAYTTTGLPMFYRDQCMAIIRAIERAHGIGGVK